MKKILTITLIDNRTIESDLTDKLAKSNVPFGAGANDPFYVQMCATIAASGYPNVETESKENYTHIAPSQIKEVSFKILSK